MAPSILSTTIAALLVFGGVSATPLLTERDGQLQARASTAFNVYNCNVCIPTDEGADTSCNQRTYVHYDGDGKAQSCSKDRTAPFNGDFCSTYGTIQTPDGPGNFEATSSCSAPHDGTGGAIQGYVTPAKSGTWKYACVNNKAAAAYNCYGEEYACTYIYYCARVDAGVQH